MKMSKNLGDLTDRVKRRLFEDDKTQQGEKEGELYDVVDKDQVVAEFLELCDTVDQTEGQKEADITPTESAIKRNLTVDEKTPYLHPNFEVLVITNNTTPENTCNVIDLLHQTNEESAQENRFKIYRCKPEDAEQLSCQREFDVMFTDVDLGISNEMIRIIVAIRKSSTHNHNIPIVAVEQNKSHYRINEVTIYGVTKVDYSPLELQFVKEVFRSLSVNSAGLSHKEDAEKMTICTTALSSSEHQTLSSNVHHEQAPPASTYTTLDNSSPPSFTVPSSSILTVEISNHVNTTSSEESNQIHYQSTVASSINVTPQTVQATVIKSSHQASNIKLATQPNHPQQTQQIFNTTSNKQHVVRPTLIHQQQPRFITPSSNTAPILPKTNLFYHTIPYYPVPNPFPTIPPHQQQSSLKFNPFPSNAQVQAPQNTPRMSSDYSSYMVSGQGSLNNPLNVTMLQDDPSKHNTKERMRRERIRRSCEQFRSLLPYSNQSKKLDMATVMELTVFYIRLLQKHSTQNCQKECKDIFEFYFNNSSGTAYSSQAASAAVQLASQNNFQQHMQQHQQNKRNATEADLEDIIGVPNKSSKNGKNLTRSPPPISSPNNPMAACNQPIPAEAANQNYLKVSTTQQTVDQQQLIRQSLLQQQHMTSILNPQPTVFIPQNAQYQGHGGPPHLRPYFDPMNRGLFTRPTAMMPEFYSYGTMPTSHMYGIPSQGNNGAKIGKENNFRQPSQGSMHQTQASAEVNYFSGSATNGHFKS
uniref:BHLH domain-containing protein n=1 Tax=Clytia hemisphaerica TaxID=252671 RepID=A0A7M5WYC7_9CNID